MFAVFSLGQKKAKNVEITYRYSWKYCFSPPKNAKYKKLVLGESNIFFALVMTYSGIAISYITMLKAFIVSTWIEAKSFPP